jgi:LPXTG-motif cell wall-anchored protein
VAFTGASSVPLAVIGGLLTLTGSLAILAGHRRRGRRVNL